MIAFKDDLPVIELASGQAISFDRDWLVRSLSQAAQRAGYAKWWLAEHVAESVTTYLREQKEITVVQEDRLTKAVQSVLQVIGYGEVGRHFCPAPPKVQVSLVELAREAGTGYELAFFEKLGRRIHTLMAQRSSHFEFLGLELCVKLLKARKIWCRECDALREDIVSFARTQTGAVPADREIVFSLQ